MKLMKSCHNAILKVEKEVHEFNKPKFDEYNRIKEQNSDPTKKKAELEKLAMRSMHD